VRGRPAEASTSLTLTKIGPKPKGRPRAATIYRSHQAVRWQASPRTAKITSLLTPCCHGLLSIPETSKPGYFEARRVRSLHSSWIGANGGWFARLLFVAAHRPIKLTPSNSAASEDQLTHQPLLGFAHCVCDANPERITPGPGTYAARDLSGALLGRRRAPRAMPRAAISNPVPSKANDEGSGVIRPPGAGITLPGSLGSEMVMGLSE